VLSFLLLSVLCLSSSCHCTEIWFWLHFFALGHVFQKPNYHFLSFWMQSDMETVISHLTELFGLKVWALFG
jgi:hypothetical protein